MWGKKDKLARQIKIYSIQRSGNKMYRKIEKVLKSKPTIEGAGVHLKRAFGYYEVPLLDPFLLLCGRYAG